MNMLLSLPFIVLGVLVVLQLWTSGHLKFIKTATTNTQVGSSVENNVADAVLEQTEPSHQKQAFYDVKELYFKMSLDHFLKDNIPQFLSWSVRKENGLSLLSDFPVKIKLKDGTEHEIYIYVKQDGSTFSLNRDITLSEDEKGDSSEKNEDDTIIKQWFQENAEFIAAKIKESEENQEDVFVIPHSLLIDNVNLIMDELSNMRFPQSVLDDNGNLIVAIP